jgi:hypothetical protein
LRFAKHAKIGFVIFNVLSPGGVSVSIREVARLTNKIPFLKPSNPSKKLVRRSNHQN